MSLQHEPNSSEAAQFTLRSALTAIAFASVAFAALRATMTRELGFDSVLFAMLFQIGLFAAIGSLVGSVRGGIRVGIVVIATEFVFLFLIYWFVLLMFPIGPP